MIEYKDCHLPARRDLAGRVRWGHGMHSSPRGSLEGSTGKNKWGTDEGAASGAGEGKRAGGCRAGAARPEGDGANQDPLF